MKTRNLILSACFILLLFLPQSECLSQYYDPGIPDTVLLENLVTGIFCPGYNWIAVLPIRVFNDEYLHTLYIPLKWTGPLEGDSEKFAGERAPFISFGEIQMGFKNCTIGISHLDGEPFLPPGDDTLVYLYFSVEDTGLVSFDTTSGGPGENYLHFYDSTFRKIQPYIERPREFNVYRYPPGDVTTDGQIDIGDVVLLVNYLFRQGPPPVPMELGDVNHDCAVDIGDVVYLINYLFRNGPAPQDGCG